jgi:DNA (cytosine-5)-methyltransferase 1
MKILNLYSGLGGNRKLWGNEYNITSVEYDENIAEVYSSYFPKDNVIVTDAHKYLLENYKNYDFIWSSPPCPTHSDIRRCGVHAGQYEAKYPEMDLYQQIILLQNFAPINQKWVIENVKPYYDPLIKPTVILNRHLFWSNFFIPNINFNKTHNLHNDIVGSGEVYGFNVKNSKIKNKRQVLRNLVNPLVGKHILESRHLKSQTELF